jgi:hypothetical protein
MRIVVGVTPASALHGHQRADFKSARWSAQSSTPRIVMNRPSGGVPWTSLIVRMTGRNRSRSRGARELLGDEADTLTDEDIELIRRHAETVAQVVVEMFVESRQIPG